MIESLSVPIVLARRAVASPSRRAFLAACGACLVAVSSPWQPAYAHHGFIGQYDFTRPIYLAGLVTHTYVGYPHARLTLRVPATLQLPRDREGMRALEDAEARLTLSLLIAARQRGLVDLSLGGAMTRRLLDDPGLVSVGTSIEAVAYRRTTKDEYHNELHVVLLVLRDGRVLVSSSPAVSGR